MCRYYSTLEVLEFGAQLWGSDVYIRYQQQGRRRYAGRRHDTPAGGGGTHQPARPVVADPRRTGRYHRSSAARGVLHGPSADALAEPGRVREQADDLRHCPSAAVLRRRVAAGHRGAAEHRVLPGPAAAQRGPRHPSRIGHPYRCALLLSVVVIEAALLEAVP